MNKRRLHFQGPVYSSFALFHCHTITLNEIMDSILLSFGRSPPRRTNISEGVYDGITKKTISLQKMRLI